VIFIPIPREFIEVYREQGYHFIGKQACVKPCHWLRKALKTGGKYMCYKYRFFGIPSHRCLQMTPIIQCNLRCVFCWRTHPQDIGIYDWDETKVDPRDLDDPETIAENALKEWRRVLSGFIGSPSIPKKLIEEALRPIHVTFSLTGEPFLYPYLGELVYEFFRRGFRSVFIVTNGTMPEAMSKLEYEPSQLYLSLYGANEEMFKLTARPLSGNLWSKVLESLELLKSFKCPTVLRLTLVKGFNMERPEEYAKLVVKAEPTYVEAKAAMALGYFRYRLSNDAMPRHSEIRKFAEKIAEETGYYIVDESLHSRVVLLCKFKKPIEIIPKDMHPYALSTKETEEYVESDEE